MGRSPRRSTLLGCSPVARERVRSAPRILGTCGMTNRHPPGATVPVIERGDDGSPWEAGDDDAGRRDEAPSARPQTPRGKAIMLIVVTVVLLSTIVLCCRRRSARPRSSTASTPPGPDPSMGNPRISEGSPPGLRLDGDLSYAGAVDDDGLDVGGGVEAVGVGDGSDAAAGLAGAGAGEVVVAGDEGAGAGVGFAEVVGVGDVFEVVAFDEDAGAFGGGDAVAGVGRKKLL